MTREARIVAKSAPVALTGPEEYGEGQTAVTLHRFGNLVMAADSGTSPTVGK